MAVTEQLLPTPAEAQDFPTSNEFIHTSIRHISDVPEVRANTPNESEEFWGQRKLRADNEGGSYHNMPILGLGVTVHGDHAVLTVPTKEHVNWVVDTYNPGGFKFVDVGPVHRAEAPDDPRPLLSTDQFLDLVSRRLFPMSSDHRLRVSSIPDRYLAAAHGADKLLDGFAQGAKSSKEEKGKTFAVMSPAEHDMVDHVALAALPESEAAKIEKLAKIIKLYKQRSGATDIAKQNTNYCVANLDLALDTIAYYAILPTTPRTSEEVAAKTRLIEAVNEKLCGLVYRIYGKQLEKLHKQGKSQDELKAQIQEEFAIDREAFDERIAIMQSAPPLTA